MTSILIFCTVVIAICTCVMFHSTKTIAARLHCRAIGIEYEAPKPKPKSPYGIVRTYSNEDKVGYSVTKHGEIYRSSKFASAPVFYNIKGAIRDMNIYEQLEGYELTVLEIDE